MNIKNFKIFYLLLSVLFLIYLLPGSQDFPPPPANAPQSGEPADTETPLRRAYFTDLSREEVINHYKENFKGMVTLNFNYPPEEAQTIIRDQTRSWYLEELVHPFRESLYINGFIPQDDSEIINHRGQEYYQKITIRYVPSSLVVRVFTGLGIVTAGYFVIILFLQLLPKSKKIILNVIHLLR